MDRNRPRHLAIAALLGLAAIAFAAPASAFVVYTVGGDASCGYAFIQDAIDAAHDNPGEDYIFIASNRTYADQHLVITDQDVDIEGGFTDCSDFDPGVDQTTISGTSGHSVFEIEGTSHVLLGNMVITGAVMDADHSGGGIYFGGQGALQLNIAWVFANQAGYGGGIDVSPSGPTTLTLTSSVVSANTALVSGGGIRIEGPTTLIATHAPSQYDNYISQNAALGDSGFGGGIEVLGPATANFSSVLALNTAAYGGGMAVIAQDAGPATVNVYTTDGNSPVSIYGNHATQYGGGIFVEPNPDNQNNALVCMNDLQLDANTANVGAAIYMWADTTFGANAFLNTPVACTAPADSVPCNPGIACNEINDNIAELSDGTPMPGAMIRATNGSAFAASRFTAHGNSGSNLIEFASDLDNTDFGNYMHLHDCVLAGNVVGDNLINGEGGSAGSQIIVDTCTIADNLFASSGHAVVNAAINFVEVTNSIVYQPDHEVVDFAGPAGDLTARYVLTNSTTSLESGTGIISGAPSFADAFNGNYRLVPTSMGIDLAPALDGIDRDGNPRTVDQLGIPDQWGPMDVGAYELQSQIPFGCAVADTIFCYGFDGEL